MFQANKPLHRAGAWLIPLKPRQKAPVDPQWTSADRYEEQALKRALGSGQNIGLRAGVSKLGDLYLHILDMDIRDPAYLAEAHAYLDSLAPNWRTFDIVISGSGGESRHIYFLTDKQFSSKLLAASEGTFEHEKLVKGVKKMVKSHFWEIELFGVGKQVAIPPSIHPDTGLEYRWEREIDFDLIDMGCPANYVPASEVVGWARQRAEVVVSDDPDDLIGDVKYGPIGDISIESARATLSTFDFDWWNDRPTWINAGMALKHEFGDTEAAYGLWVEFSKLSPKFDKRETQHQWNSFKNEAGGVTFRSMLQAEREFRAKATMAEVAGGDFEDDDDLIGDVAEDDDDLIGMLDDDDDLIGMLDDDDEDLIGGAPPEKPKEASATKWTNDLVLTPKEELESGLTNARIIIANDPRLKGIMRFNEFRGSLVLAKRPKIKRQKEGKKPPFNLTGGIWKVQDKLNGDLWSDSREKQIRALIEAPDALGGYGMKLTDRDLNDAFDVVGQADTFHPVKDYLESETWNGTEQVETLFIDYFGVADTPYHRAIARTMMIAAVARIYEPGCKFDYAVIIEGKQGVRKSTFIKTLASNWFSELSSEFTDEKKMVESMSGSFIIEIGELSGFNRHENAAVKAFISRTVDKVRMSYQRNVGEFKRCCIFIGSTNDKRYLRDETGGRRFWPVEVLVDSIDTDKLKRCRGQLWAEARHLYQQMRLAQPDGDLPLYLVDEDANNEALFRQESRRIETSDDALTGQVQEWLDTPVKGDSIDDEAGEVGVLRERVCLMQIGVEGLGIPKAAYNERAALSQQLSRVMGRVKGWVADERYRFPSWGQQRSYVRG